MAGKAKTAVLHADEVYYRLPESAREMLGEIRDQLDVLAHLTVRHCCGEEETVQLSSTALSQCFARVALEIDEVIQACLTPAGSAGMVKRGQ
ncbi:XAC0095 family protein [Dyella mobilis]|uniref:XAC0095-like domain-containing protein n=1 Tax=Dyella mobilis TaxID=1849582 RepID=A0ABS2KDV8_9GAMM|nr:hypothetical protein [Dyella mobilis]MBM7129354.1 hypothetical protein [Dyella mobilis]GLQ98648.1 hypothetical protein GCM10007863_30680 [Dyella mobilis]